MFKRENEKLSTEKYVSFMHELLKEDDNKYCVDCDAKGPRWASWNIGVFLCIRCAGIHRNMGVHVSRVKSVNLDTWTPAQLAMMKAMGNSQARAIYEAQLPENYRRPQADAALESFIRAKYEQKRYIAPTYVAPNPDVETVVKELQRLEHVQKKRINVTSVNLANPPPSGASVSRPIGRQTNTKVPICSRAEADLIGLTQGHPDTGANKRSLEADIGDFLGSSSPVNSSAPETAVTSTTLPSETSSVHSDLLGLDFGSSVSGATTTSATCNPAAGEGSCSKQVSKESILALYGKPTTMMGASCDANSSGQFGSAVTTNGALFQDLLPTGVSGQAFTSSSSKPTTLNESAGFDHFAQFQTADYRGWPLHPQQQQHQAHSQLPSFMPPHGPPPSYSVASSWPNANADTSKPVGFTTTAAFTTVSHATAAAQQTYLSQVQSQLSALQLGGNTSTSN